MLTLHIAHLKQLVYRFVGLSVLFAAFGLQAVDACDTPVYRYAMYRWEPAPYEIYYFHEEPIAEEAAKLQAKIQEVSRSEEKPANVIFIPVPLKEDTELKRVPPDVKKGWQEIENPQIPSYMVVTPHGVRLHLGDLDEATLKSLLDSPARVQIAKQLEEGKASVLVLLTGTEKEANAEAEKAATALIKDIADGKVELYMAPPAYGPPGEEAADAPKIEVGYVKVQRDDPKEKWLVESLLSIEADLKDEEFVDKPMVFGVFGRGRALPPFVGKGINPDNLLDCVDFVTGACSCTVKDQNPGMDLLFTKDWWTAAEKLANQFGAEEGAEAQYGPADFFPQLMIPDEEGEEKAGEGSEDESAEVAAADEEKMAEDKPPAEEPAGEAPAESESGDAETPAKEEPKADTEEPAAATEDEPATPLAGDAPKPDEKEPPAAVEGEESAMQEEATTADDEPVGTETIITADEEKLPADRDATAGEDEPRVDTATTSPAAGRESSAAEPKASVGILAVGVGIAVSLLLLFALTFAVLRPK